MESSSEEMVTGEWFGLGSVVCSRMHVQELTTKKLTNSLLMKGRRCGLTAQKANHSGLHQKKRGQQVEDLQESAN